MVALTNLAEQHRTSGGHRLSQIAGDRIEFDWQATGDDSLAAKFKGRGIGEAVATTVGTLTMTVKGFAVENTANAQFTIGENGLGISTADAEKFDRQEAIEIQFDHDVVVESATIIAGDGTCGGYYTMASGAPLAIYCVDADNDARDQSGVLSDMGVLKAGQTVRLDSARHFGTEAAGAWSLGSLRVRLMKRR